MNPMMMNNNQMINQMDQNQMLQMIQKNNMQIIQMIQQIYQVQMLNNMILNKILTNNLNNNISNNNFNDLMYQNNNFMNNMNNNMMSNDNTMNNNIIKKNDDNVVDPWKGNNAPRIDIVFKWAGHWYEPRLLPVPQNITVKELIQGFIKKYKAEKEKIHLIFNGEDLQKNDTRKIEEIFMESGHLVQIVDYGF